MTATIRHDHEVLRVVRAGWDDPLDASFSCSPEADNRWNTRAFPALYCCCSEAVARAVTRDLLRIGGVEAATELRPAFRPELAVLAWSGEVVDVASAGGIAAAGLPAGYPEGVAKTTTREHAAAWHSEGAVGVVYRSASLHRLGINVWQGDHRPWGELAIWVENATVPPRLLNQRRDQGWLRPAPR